MRNRVSAAIVIMTLSSAAGLAQVDIRPDPTPRLPPQAGQGLPVEDRQFISRAVNLSEAEIEAGRLAADRTDSAALKEFGQRLVTEHEKLRQAAQQLAQTNGIAIEPHASRSWWQEELRRIGSLKGEEFDREYMDWQLRTHLALVNLYQTEASHSPELDLSKFAITALVEIQRLFDQAKRLGAEHGVAVDTIKQPPQY